MAPLQLTVVRPFEEPPAPTDLVVFAHPTPYVPSEEVQPFLRDAIRYARRHETYLVPSPFAADGQLGLCLISPKGEILGGQRATHLSLSLREDFARSTDLNVIDTPLGRIFLAPDLSLCQPEVCRGAGLAGAQLLIGSRFLSDLTYLPIKGRLAALGAAALSGAYALDVSSLAINLASPKEEEGLLLADWEVFPVTVGPERGLDPAALPPAPRPLTMDFYKSYAPQLGEEVERCCAPM